MAVQIRQLDNNSDEAVLLCTTTNTLVSTQVFDIEDAELFLDSLSRDIREYDEEEIRDLYYGFRVKYSNNNDIR